VGYLKSLVDNLIDWQRTIDKGWPAAYLPIDLN
jgi:hypothetical protein